MHTTYLPNAALPLPYGPPDPGSIRALLGLTQAAMAAAIGVTPNTWARWERSTLAIHPAYQLLLDLIEHKADRDADRVAMLLTSRYGPLRPIWATQQYRSYWTASVTSSRRQRMSISSRLPIADRSQPTTAGLPPCASNASSVARLM